MTSHNRSSATDVVDLNQTAMLPLPNQLHRDRCMSAFVCRVRVHGLVARFLAHDLFRKPVPIPDHTEDMLFGIMRQPGNAVSTSLTQYEVPIGITSSLKL